MYSVEKVSLLTDHQRPLLLVICGYTDIGIIPLENILYEMAAHRIWCTNHIHNSPYERGVMECLLFRYCHAALQLQERHALYTILTLEAKLY